MMGMSAGRMTILMIILALILRSRRRLSEVEKTGIDEILIVIKVRNVMLYLIFFV
jgi:hypothetical protein